MHVRNGSSALHTVTPDDGALDAKNNDTTLSVTRLSAMPLKPLEKIHQLACLHTLQPVSTKVFLMCH